MTKPRDVQFEALRRSAGKEGYIYGMEPGLGKTAVALWEFERLRTHQNITTLLVVCPNSVIGVWEDEIYKHGFSIPSRLIINYEALIYSGGDYAKNFMRGKRILLVVDESHRIKNYSSKTCKFITKEIYPKVQYVRLLTGTPLAESPMDLFPQLRLCGATPGVNPYGWRGKWCKMGGFKLKNVVGVKDPAGLAKFCEPYMFRATKEEWAKDLPDKTFSVRRLPMSPEMARVYYEMKREFCSEFGGKEITSTMIMSVMTKMSQISAGFVIADDGTAIPLGERNPKLEALTEWAEEFRHKQKFVVVAVNKFIIAQCATTLNKAGFKVLTLYGDSEMSVDEAKDKFNNDDSYDGIVLSIKKGGVGLTLLGSEKRPCSDMAFIQTAWSYIDRTQVVDRIHRIGQKWPCNYIDFCTSDLDLEIVKRLNQKEDAVYAVMDFLGVDATTQRMRLA